MPPSFEAINLRDPNPIQKFTETARPKYNERGKRRAGVANNVGSGSEGDKSRKSDAGRHVKKLHHHHTKGTSSFYF